MHDAFRAALEQWPRDGVPATRAPGWSRPAASRRSTACAGEPGSTLARRRWPSATSRRRRRPRPGPTRESVEDDRLRLIFTCCHPALAPDAQVALTLREVCGLTTEEIAQRLPHRRRRRSRSGSSAPRRKIRDAAHPVSGAGAGGAARAARRGAARDLPRVQRGLQRVVRRRADAARSVGRSDPARAAAGRAAAASRRRSACSR